VDPRPSSQHLPLTLWRRGKVRLSKLMSRLTGVGAGKDASEGGLRPLCT
jgi:hypothetical protein